MILGESLLSRISPLTGQLVRTTPSTGLEEAQSLIMGMMFPPISVLRCSNCPTQVVNEQLAAITLFKNADDLTILAIRWCQITLVTLKTEVYPRQNNQSYVLRYRRIKRFMNFRNILPYMLPW